MNQAPETTARTLSYDPWDQASETMWYVHIEPDTLQGLWTEEQPTLYINRDGDGYWLGEPRTMGQGQFETLEAAKAAGNEILLRAEEGMAAKMLQDAGLDASTWSFEYREGARFKHAEDAALVIEIDIEGTDVADRFAALSGDEEVGAYATAAEAATALLDRPAPGI